MKTHMAFLLLILLFVANTVSAQTTTTDRVDRVEERQENIDIRQEERTEQIEGRQENRLERRAELSDRMQERVTNLSANLSNRFDAVIERLFNILNRLQSRMNKLSEQGWDTSEAQSYLDTARRSLTQAEENMSDIDTVVAGVVGASNPREAWQELKAIYVETRELIRSAHADMKTAILSLKNPAVEDETSSEGE
jgi:uncharacterized protein YukE